MSIQLDDDPNCSVPVITQPIFQAINADLCALHSLGSTGRHADFFSGF